MKYGIKLDTGEIKFEELEEYVAIELQEDIKNKHEISYYNNRFAKRKYGSRASAKIISVTKA